MRIAAAVIAVVAALACQSGKPAQPEEREVALQGGTYRVVAASGYAPADAAAVLAVTARLDREARQLVLTLADGSTQALALAPRPRDRWVRDCYTMASHTVNEIAALSPAPLRIASFVISAPVVHPKCGPDRVLLREDGPTEGERVLVLDRQ